ncbi:MAG: B12-binding domain-containing radical SAM protein [Flavobacterium sp.]|nr:MAG: B12-binding domain-containing radical SAM protein [Flavobacterium sp.]
MSILLTHTYFLSADAKEQKIMRPYPPLGLLYVSSYLTQQGIPNEVFDSTFSSKEEQLAFIGKHKPKIVAIYANLMTKIEVVRLMKILKSNPEYGFPKIVLGGPDVTYNCENYLKSGADFLVIGEGEETMAELYKVIRSGEDSESVNGIAVLKNGMLVKTAPRTKFRELDNLPLPNRAAAPMEKYLQTWKENHGKSSMTISTQRGCPYTCKWCSTAVYGQSYRRRPAILVAQEMAMLKQTYNPDTIWFVDDVFTISHKWLGAFRDAIFANDAVIPFECITRAERLNTEILQLLRESGCYRIWIGAESGSQKIIDLMDRRVNVDTVKNIIQETNSMGIETGTFIMVGYPGETKSDIEQTIRYLKEANPTHYTITIAYPIKGTSLYNEVENAIITNHQWETSTDREIDFKRTYRRKFYEYAVSKVVSEVEFHREAQRKSRNAAKMLKLKTKSIVAGMLMAINK